MNARFFVFVCLAVLALQQGHAVLLPPPSYVVPPGNHTGELMGAGGHGTVAVGGGFMVIGSYNAIRPAGLVRTGGVYVFKTSGAFVRAIYPADGVLDDDFGRSVAITGNTLIVGAPSRDQSGFNAVGAVYLYNLTTGAFIRRIDAPAPLNTASGWGSAVAGDGDLVVVGAPFYDGGAGADTGAIFTHRISTNTTSAIVSGSAANRWLGRSLAIWKGLIAAGSPGSPTSDGRVVLFDVNNLALLRTLVDTLPPGHQGRFGMSVAMDADLLVVGAPESSAGGAFSGRVVVFDVNTVGSFPDIGSSNGSAGDFLGASVATKDQKLVLSAPGALSGRGRVLLTDPGFNPFSTLSPAGSSGASVFGGAIALGRDGTLVATDEMLDAPTADSGALWRAGPFLAENPKLSVLAQSGESAAGAGLTSYSAFTEISASLSGTTPGGSYVAALTGTGASAGRSKGVWSTVALPGAPAPALGMQTGVSTGLAVPPFASFATGRVVTRPIHNNDFIYFFKGIKTVGSSLFAFDSGNRLREMIVANAALFPGGPVPLSLHETRVLFDAFAFVQPMKLKLGTGTTAVTAASDSALYAGGLALTREGVSDTTLAGTPKFGEISPRAANASAGNLAFHAFVQTTGTPFSSVFQNSTAIVSTGETAHSSSGALLPPSPSSAPVYSAFLGESSLNNRVIFRASLKLDAGAGVTTANNEGLWVRNSLGPKLVARKGDTISGTSLKWSRFIDYGIDHWGDVLIRATVSGVGVTARNDGLLVVLYGGDPTKAIIILREGSAAPGCDGARIDTINLVDMPFFDSSRNAYGVLATLVVAPGEATAGNNLVWLTGDFSASDPSLLYSFLPAPRLRKGERMLSLPGRDALTSIAFPATLRDGTGAGNTGMAHVLSRDQSTMAVVTFPDRSKALVTRNR
jgi:hypothetical protein